jgi:hypothetical protein
VSPSKVPESRTEPTPFQRRASMCLVSGKVVSPFASEHQNPAVAPHGPGGVLHFLFARRERPRSHRAAEERDKFAASHSITSSARNSRPGETSRPSAFAVFRLITN